MKPRPLFPASLLALACLFGTVSAAAFETGGSAYTKRLETILRAEPRPLAAESGRIGYARQLRIEELRGNWLHVREGRTRGWVFAGNLSETKPAEDAGIALIPFDASSTSATAAARPLTPTTVDYSGRHQLSSAKADLEWLIEQSAYTTNADVTAYLQENNKGEYQ